MTMRGLKIAIGVLACSGLGLFSPMHAAETTPPVKSSISEEASTAVAQMGKTLLNKELSFDAKTIRVYLNEAGQTLHIFHAMKVAVRRPDRIAVRVDGDDGLHDLFYDGKSVSLFAPGAKKYATIAAGKDLAGTLDEVSDKLGVDFPLADFFSDAPDKSVLSGVTTGSQLGLGKIDGVECRHLFFSQQGGIDLELWIEKTDAALPRRVIVTYRLLPGQPNFIAELSNWNTNAHSSDADFAFQPPVGATKIDLVQAAAPNQGDRK